MSKKQLLMNELEEIPDSSIDEVLDFVHFMKARILRSRLEISIASESSLKTDWLRPEEDAAWRDL